jgi:hypothetical protein
VAKDTDGDGIPDWEEGLYGTDPMKKETTPGIPDSTTIAKLKTDQGPVATNGDNTAGENLTKTDQFSRDLFATVAATTQNGSLDQATADQISSSLADNIQNSAPRKVYTLSDIKIINDDSTKTVQKYSDAMHGIHVKYPIKGDVLSILQKFLGDGSDVDVSALAELDVIAKPMQNTIDAITKVSVPQPLVPLHLDFLNGMERVEENLKDIQLYDIDPVVAMGGISKYVDNIDSLQSAFVVINNAINQKLKN